MFSLAYKEDREVIIGDGCYFVDTSFDNVLKVIDMLNDQEVGNVADKIVLGLAMLLRDEHGERFDFTNQLFQRPMEVLEQALDEICKTYIDIGKKKEIRRDLQGNVIPTPQEEEEENSYSLKHDAEFIYASFMQAYGIDLIEAQGKLSWAKFQALLVGLPSDTKFSQVVAIRTWKKPSKSESETSRMQKLKDIYKLPEGGEIDG
ncbi:hypothetical protein M2149_000777 [Lachnospiraceae bacterium PFB1-21]